MHRNKIKWRHTKTWEDSTDSEFWPKYRRIRRLYAASHKAKFYGTPTNASWLNRIESYFTALRKFTLDNTDYRSHEEMQTAIEDYLSCRNRTREISMKNWKSYRRTHKKNVA